MRPNLDHTLTCHLQATGAQSDGPNNAPLPRQQVWHPNELSIACVFTAGARDSHAWTETPCWECIYQSSSAGKVEVRMCYERPEQETNNASGAIVGAGIAGIAGRTAALTVAFATASGSPHAQCGGVTQVRSVTRVCSYRPPIR